MPTAPSGYIWLKAALARLGPLLIGSEWIAELTRRERWLVENHARGAGSIIPGGITLVPHDERDELGPALNRDRKMRSQNEQAEEWLGDRDLLFEGDDGKGTVVPIAGFEAALKEDGLLGMEVAAQASASTADTASAPSSDRKKTTARKRDVAADAELRNRIQSVLAAAKAKWPKSDSRPSCRAMAGALAGTLKAQGFKLGSLRQILQGTYPPMKRRKLSGL